MQIRKIDTITSNEDQVRFEIFSGTLPIDAAGAELLRIERAQYNAERSRHMDTRDRMGAEIGQLRLLLKHADDVVIWEHTPARSGFQEEIEEALGIGIVDEQTQPLK